MRYCESCGKPEGYGEGKVEFRSDRAHRCVNCDVVSAKQRKKYHRQYHQDRGKAVTQLIHAHREEFAELVAAERDKRNGVKANANYQELKGLFEELDGNE